jgi:hypothetical protein
MDRDAVKMRNSAMAGDFGTWWVVLCSLLVVLALPSGGARSRR